MRTKWKVGEVSCLIQGFTCGLEGSAAGGEGFGIEKFKPQRGPLQISTNLKIPNVAKVLLRDGENAEGYVTRESRRKSKTQWKPWKGEEIDKTNMKGERLLVSIFACSNCLPCSPIRAWQNVLEASGTRPRACITFPF